MKAVEKELCVGLSEIPARILQTVAVKLSSGAFKKSPQANKEKVFFKKRKP